MKPNKGIRWWPTTAILAVLAAYLCWIWIAGNPTRQVQVMQTLQGVVLAVFLLLIWLLLLSRARWKTRLLVLVALVALGFGLSRLVRIRGVSGDLVPILDWRWNSSTLSTTAVGGAAELMLEAPSATDWPQFLGPQRDGAVDVVRLATDWTAQPPVLRWRQPIGAGWSSFAIVGHIVVSQEQRGAEELVTAYELASGRLLWTHADQARYATTIGGEGPRATPTVVGGVVYTAGATGLLNAIDLATGRRLWGHDLVAEYGATQPDWGRAGSPLVLDELVAINGGGAAGRSLLAFDRQSGDLIWSAGNDPAAYSSPLFATLAGVPQIVSFNASSVTGHDPVSGRVLWRYPWPSEQPNVSQPVTVGDDRLFVSSGYGIGGKMLRLASQGDGSMSVELLWESPRLKAKFTDVVLHDGYLYGLDDGVMVCLDPETGERRWKRGRYGHGQTLLVGDLLLVTGEHGEVFLLEAIPEEHRQLASFRALDGKTWNPPALSGNLLLLRNDREAALYELPLAG